MLKGDGGGLLGSNPKGPEDNHTRTRTDSIVSKKVGPRNQTEPRTIRPESEWIRRQPNLDQ